MQRYHIPKGKGNQDDCVRRRDVEGVRQAYRIGVLEDTKGWLAAASNCRVRQDKENEWEGEYTRDVLSDSNYRSESEESESDYSEYDYESGGIQYTVKGFVRQITLSSKYSTC